MHYLDLNVVKTKMFPRQISCPNEHFTLTIAATVSPSFRGWVLESQPRQTYVVQTGSDNSSGTRSQEMLVSQVLGNGYINGCSVSKCAPR